MTFGPLPVSIGGGFFVFSVAVLIAGSGGQACLIFTDDVRPGSNPGVSALQERRVSNLNARGCKARAAKLREGVLTAVRQHFVAHARAALTISDPSSHHRPALPCHAHNPMLSKPKKQ